MKRREFAIKSALTTAFAYSGSAYALFDPGKANDTINIGVIEVQEIVGLDS
ncbi:hypothetical protein [Allomuricauda sp. R78024]|uniref:hypothetical protein n=1 Tax=Allomuricauda sp. R78024 TaxID=3093867 RepID=UPI0037C5088F